MLEAYFNWCWSHVLPAIRWYVLSDYKSLKETNIASGINALIYYSPSLFETLGQNYEMQLLLSGIINCTQLVGVVTSLWTMDRFGRRPLLLTGAGLMFICHLIIAVLVGKFAGGCSDYAVEGWVAVAFLFFYMFSFGATWGPVPWAMPSEIFPSSLRAKGVALSTCSNWFNNFIIVSPLLHLLVSY